MVEYALTMGFVKIIFVDHEPHYLFVVEAKYGFAGHTSFCALKKLKNNPLRPPLPKEGARQKKGRREREMPINHLFSWILLMYNLSAAYFGWLGA